MNSKKPNPKTTEAEKAAKFYRELLETIASSKRKTIGSRLASSGLLFWDSITQEKTK